MRSLEQLMPFATAGELIAENRRPVVSISPDDRAVAALGEMGQKDIAFLPVLDGEKLVGVVSERDIGRGMLLPQRAAVRDIMTTQVHTVAPDARVPECVALMHRSRLRHLPVVKHGRVLGVLSVPDLMGSLFERHERLLRRLHDEPVTLLFPYRSGY
jgi:CBS domain-containing protein